MTATEIGARTCQALILSGPGIMLNTTPAAGRQLTALGLMRRAYQGMQEVPYVDFFYGRR